MKTLIAKLCTEEGAILVPHEASYSWNLQNRLDSRGRIETKFVNCPSLILLTTVYEDSCAGLSAPARSQTIFPFLLTPSISCDFSNIP